MPKFFRGLAALALLCGAAPARAQEEDAAAREAARGYRHPWEGFGIGSKVAGVETYKAGIFSPATGKTVYKDVQREISWSVLKADPQQVTVRVKGGNQESYIPYPLALPGSFRGKGERKGLEEIRVGERKFLCAVTTISLDMEKEHAAGQVTTVCKSSDAPYWAVRYVVETYMGGQRLTSQEELLVGLNEKLKVGDREVLCQVVRVTTEAPGGARTVSLEWRTEEIPGRLARREHRQYASGKEVEGAAVTMEVVSFEAKK